MSRLEVRDLTVEYPVVGGTVHAVDGVSLSLNGGEIVGVVGESGSGKTSLVLAVLRLVPLPGRVVSGQVLLDGCDLRELAPVGMRKLRGKALAYVPQAAMSSLNPVLTIGWQVDESLSLHTELRGGAAEVRVREVLEMVDLPPDVARRYPHELSGGMRQRAAIAMALAPQPLVLLADEPTSGLDVLVRVEILGLLRRLVAELGLALLLVSHDLRLVSRWCDRAVVMYAGRLADEGPAADLLSGSLHPYAAALAQSLPTLRGDPGLPRPIPGETPDSTRLPGGCAFHPRCRHIMPVCSVERPALYDMGDRRVACHLYSLDSGERPHGR